MPDLLSALTGQDALIMLLLAVVGLLSGWVDSIAGGGGLVTLPALLALGMPPVTALGTNKVAATFGSSTATLRYGRAGAIGRLAWPMAGLALVASPLGALAATRLPAQAMEVIVVVGLLAVAIYTALRRDFGDEARPRPWSAGWQSAVATMAALTIGFYDGLLGPGTGTFLAFAFVGLLGLDFLQATGSTKLVNFATNISAAIFFAWQGLVVWHYALPMGVGILLGAYIGSGMTLKVGSKLIRPIFVLVAAALAVKLLFFR